MWHRQYIIDSLTANIKVSPKPLFSENGPLRFKENKLSHEPTMNVRRKERKHGGMTDRMDEQECIPVGCGSVPHAAVAVEGVSTRHPLREQTPPGAGIPPMNRITDTCKNITFKQLRLRAGMMEERNKRRYTSSEGTRHLFSAKLLVPLLLKNYFTRQTNFCRSDLTKLKIYLAIKANSCSFHVWCSTSDKLRVPGQSLRFHALQSQGVQSINK